MTNALKPGDVAPEFMLRDQTGTEQRLSDYRGNWIVLYFYPRDDTPGCSKEACAFRDDILRLNELGARVFGVSLDDRGSHQRFIERYDLPFPLLSDITGETAKAYGALFSLGLVRIAKRHSFIIDPRGRIAGVYRKVRPKSHSSRVIRDLGKLQRRFE